MAADKLMLMQPALEWESEFFAMVTDFRNAGEARFDAVPELMQDDFPAYVRRLDQSSRGEGLPPGHVPATAYWLVRDEGRVILGVGWLRHTLSPALEQEGGHIGYAIRPSARNKGYATLMLALILAVVKQLGLPRVLVTCDTDNTASARVIQKNGGILTSEGISTQRGKAISRYWIEI